MHSGLGVSRIGRARPLQRRERSGEHKSHLGQAGWYRESFLMVLPSLQGFKSLVRTGAVFVLRGGLSEHDI